jgi:uncharacterized protein involved in exopolysaccharide biosynthesis
MNRGQLSLAALSAGTLTRWREALTVAAGVVVVALVSSVVLPPSYRAMVSFVTTDAGIQLPRGLSDLATQPGVAGLASQLGIGTSKDPSESPAFYVALLNSRELLTRLVLSRFADPRTEAPGDSATLVELFQIRSSDPARAVEIAVKRLRRKLRSSADLHTSLVSLQVDARWPSLSADIANRAMALVSAFNREQRLSRSRARREFLESRVVAALAELRAAEDSQRLFYQRNRQWENSPTLIVDERRVRRQVETANDLYLALRREFESARTDEINTTPVVTVVDEAVPPRRPQWPQRTLLVLTAAFLGAALGVLWAAARELFTHWARGNPEEADMLRRTATQVRHEVRGVFRRRRGREASQPGP